MHEFGNRSSNVKGWWDCLDWWIFVVWTQVFKLRKKGQLLLPVIKQSLVVIFVFVILTQITSVLGLKKQWKKANPYTWYMIILFSVKCTLEEGLVYVQFRGASRFQCKWCKTVSSNHRSQYYVEIYIAPAYPVKLKLTVGIDWPSQISGLSSFKSSSTHVNPWLIHVNVQQKSLQYCN